MRKIINFKLACLIIVAFVTMNSCSDEVSVENRNELSQDTFFENLSQIESSANAAYAQLQNGGLYQRFAYILPDGFSDENVSGMDPNFLPVFNFQLTPSLEQTSRYWNNCYNGIGAANFVIGNEDTMMSKLVGSDFSEADVKDAVGQGYFLRGLYFYLLVKRYGGVPLPDENTFGALPRSSVDETYQRIIDDFKAASDLLYDKQSTERGRATRGAALGMLGKVYLHREMYTEAQSTFESITDYSLLPLENYEDNFNNNGEFNDESMFEVTFSGEVTESDLWQQTGQGVSEVTFHSQEYTGWGNYRPSQKLQDEFEDDDPRFKIAFINGSEDLVGPNRDVTPDFTDVRWFKFSELYDNSAVVQNGSVNARVLRYADVVLMQAEVENKLNNDPKAIDFLNQIRTRVEMPLYGTPEMDAIGYPVSTSQEVFNAIVHERMVELCGEQVRFDDLVRWGLDAQELAIDDSGASRGYNPDVHRLIPIPQVEIDANENISPGDQNSGY